VLAGDYCKSASDARANFVAVGLLYEQGYFTQTVDNDGNQHAEYSDATLEICRLSRLGWPRRVGQVTVRIAGRDVVSRLWKAQVGRVPVYLLDTNCRRTRLIATSLTGSMAAMSPPGSGKR